ncbi:hypothetical protein SVAN01_03830 [Stagonosporopsis vannaccii]|nr:hypothetical protein SVAN01_03830 [Stagonosporopsis vannaccii]
MQTVAPLGVPDRCTADGSGEGSGDSAHSLAARPWQGTGARREARNGAASALEAKMLKNAHGVGNVVEALRHRSLVRASDGASKMPRRSRSRAAAGAASSQQPAASSQQQRPARRASERAAAAARRALHPKLALLAAEAWRRAAEAALVEGWLLAANVIKLHPCWRCTVSCYPTRLISPAAQRRAMLLGPRRRGEGGRPSAVAVGQNRREHHAAILGLLLAVGAEGGEQALPGAAALAAPRMCPRTASRPVQPAAGVDRRSLQRGKAANRQEHGPQMT